MFRISILFWGVKVEDGIEIILLRIGFCIEIFIKLLGFSLCGVFSVVKIK